MTAEVTIPVEFKIVQRIHSLTRRYFSLLCYLFTHYCWFFLKLMERLQKLIPKGTSFHPWKKCKNFWEVPISPGLYRAWSAVKMTRLCSHSSPLEPTLWVVNLGVACPQSQANRSCKCFQALRFSTPVVPLHSWAHHPNLHPNFDVGFSASLWIWIMKTVWSELQDAATPDFARDTAMILPDSVHRNHLTNL